MKTVKPTIDFLINDSAVVYSLPMMYERINQAINHPRSSIDDITRIISEDQGLSTRILKLANSPMFGYYARIDSITKAVTIIGTRQLRDLALAISVMGVFKGIPEDLINMTSFWQHSIACGTIARILAICRRDANVERFFIAGMLHDVGRLILCTRVPELMRELIEQSKESGCSLYSIERSVLGFDHGNVGGELLKRWKIPPSISEPVACHHVPVQVELFPIENGVIHVADVIAHAMQIGSSGEQFVPPLDEHAWERLTLQPSMLTTIIKQADVQLKETMGILSEGGAS